MKKSKIYSLTELEKAEQNICVMFQLKHDLYFEHCYHFLDTDQRLYLFEMGNWVLTQEDLISDLKQDKKSFKEYMIYINNLEKRDSIEKSLAYHQWVNIQ